MGAKLKKLEEQVIVITGASSGIGLVTARMAAGRGAKVVLAARSHDALRRLRDEIKAEGGEAIYVVVDVGREPDVRRIAREAIENFGGFDTWVNNAGVSIYGRVLDVSLEDHRRLFETNYWGLVHGSQVAAAQSSTSEARSLTAPSRYRELIAPQSTRSKATRTRSEWNWKKRTLPFP
jgi:NADP-dependent 3-hydroxy acid dehydrogenase YdfG